MSPINQGRLEKFKVSDGYVFHYRRYASTVPEKARLVCLHGIQSHGGWYQNSCGRLAAAHYAVSFLDRRGSGLNDCYRGDTPGFRRLLDDVAEFVRAERPAPTVPLFLLAISWGGKLAVALQRRHPGLVDGLVLLCPGLCPRVSPTLGERLAILRARFRSPLQEFPIPLDEPELFTNSPPWQQFIRNDPLALRRATARFMFASGGLDFYLALAPRHVHVPTLVMLAGQDRIVDNGRTRAYVSRFSTADKKIIEYPEAHHTLEFEPNPDPYLTDLVQWLDMHGREK
jgi:alpha-beta hydrolase superfamily lysophospholipase